MLKVARKITNINSTETGNGWNWIRRSFKVLSVFELLRRWKLWNRWWGIIFLLSYKIFFRRTFHRIDESYIYITFLKETIYVRGVFRIIFISKFDRCYLLEVSIICNIILWEWNVIHFECLLVNFEKYSVSYQFTFSSYELRW